MKVLIINVVCGIKSTGRICTDLAIALEEQGHEVKIAYGREKVPEQFKKYSIRIGNDLDVKMHGLKARFFDGSGFGSKVVTKRFIKWVKEFDPDIIHLHNIHGYYLHNEILFNYLKICNKKIIWSLYDCWSFTGHCAHFDYNQCNKWKIDCSKCIFSSEYPKSFIDNARQNYQKKSRLFTGINNLTLVVPSLWMEKNIKNSFLKKYDTCVIPNGINLKTFKPRKTNLKAELKLGNKYIVLGVSSFWNKMKGIDDFIKLAKIINDDDIVFILVGHINKGVLLPKNIVNIKQTNNTEELCNYYSIANCFFNPTLQETQGLTTVEALACGLPVIVYDSGGAAECVTENCGVVVKKGDVEAVKKQIKEMKKKNRFIVQDSLEAANEYNEEKYYKKMLKIYSLNSKIYSIN